MKKAKKTTAKKKAAKPAAKKKSARPVAKAAPRKSGGGGYTPQPIQGVGWAPFRYPLT